MAERSIKRPSSIKTFSHSDNLTESRVDTRSQFGIKRVFFEIRFCNVYARNLQILTRARPAWADVADRCIYRYKNKFVGMLTYFVDHILLPFSSTNSAFMRQCSRASTISLIFAAPCIHGGVSINYRKAKHYLINPYLA